MKKLISLALALVMCTCLAACGGGVDKQPAIDAHNAAGAAVNDLSAIINADPEPFADYIADMQDLVNQLNECGAFLESNEKTTQEALDQWVKTCNDIEKWAKDAKAEIEAGAQEPAQPAGGVSEAVVGTWSISGGMTGEQEWEQGDLDNVLALYNGQFDIVINADGSAQMVQGAGTLNGTCEAVDEYTLQLTFDNNGSELAYPCQLSQLNSGEIVLILAADDTQSMYFTQAA